MTAENAAASADITDRLLAIIAKEGMVDKDKLALETPLEDISVESADIVMILMTIEEEFKVYIPVGSEFSDLKTVGDLVNTLATHIARQSA